MMNLTPNREKPLATNWVASLHNRAHCAGLASMHRACPTEEDTALLGRVCVIVSYAQHPAFVGYMLDTERAYLNAGAVCIIPCRVAGMEYTRNTRYALAYARSLRKHGIHTASVEATII